MIFSTIKKIISNISAIFSAAVLTFIVVIVALTVYFNTPNFYRDSDKKFIIEKGQNFREIVQNLHKEGIVRSPLAFLYIGQIFKGYDPTIRYGEYFFEKELSYYKLMHKINKGYVSFRKITIAEGLSTNSILKILDESYGLIGQSPLNIGEGTLLPETYFYSYNDTKLATIKRMKMAMEKTIDQLWESRDKSIPIKTKKEAVILASIVEKETGVSYERPKIASVFINRLRKGMRLQSDPTIIYSFTKGDKDLERVIRRSDIWNKSRFNTYHIYGLPPIPICNPGIDSIKAVLNPLETSYLYFVASTTSSGHKFSTNLRQHNYYVYQYRKYLNDRRQARKLRNEARKLKNKVIE